MLALSVRLTAEDEERFEKLARRTGRSKTFYVGEAIHEHLRDLEDRSWTDAVVPEWEGTGRPSGTAAKVAGDIDNPVLQRLVKEARLDASDDMPTLSSSQNV
ncbi:MAG: ribbon-helix-helix domain-containing protein [Ornithinimicrobium sp.]